MPTPIQPKTSGPAQLPSLPRSKGGAATSPPVTAPQKSGAVDAYRASDKEPALPARVALGNFDGRAAFIETNGCLYVAPAPGALDGELGTITQLALAAAGNTFDKVTDPAALAAAARRLLATHRGLAGESPSQLEMLQMRQGRAAALKLLEDASVRAGELGDRPLRDRLTQMLMLAIRQEPFRALRDFAFNSLDRLGIAGKLPRMDEAARALFPDEPPYEKWLADGVITMHLVVDDDGEKLEDVADFFEGHGFTKRQEKDGSLTFTLAKGATRLPMKVIVPVPVKKGEGEKVPLFASMADPKVDIVAYAGHAGYGHRVEHALAHGVSGTGDGKVVLLIQCVGEDNIESLERAYPDAQLVSTTEETVDTLDFPALERMLQGFGRRESWAQISSGVRQALGQVVTRAREVAGGRPIELDDYKLDDHYFFPNTRTVLQKRYDRDGDGVPDAQDNIFNVVYPKRPDAAGGYDPTVQPAPDHALDGQALSKAVMALSLVFRYEKMLAPEVQARLPWSPAAVAPAGFFSPEAGDNRAFQFDEEPGTGRVKVALSTRFSHTSDHDLARMLAVEAGLWYGQKAGLDPAGRTALALSMLERVSYQQRNWLPSMGMLDEPWAEESLLLERFGLSAASFASLRRATGSPDDFLPEHYQKVLAYVRGTPALAGAADAAPRSVGTPLAVPDGIQLPARGFDAAALSAALVRMGIPGRLEGFSPDWLPAGQPNNLALAVRRPDGTLTTVVLGIDSEGILRSAATLHLDPERVADACARSSLEGMALSMGLPAERLLGTLDAALARGSSLPAALEETAVAARRLVPPGGFFSGKFDALERLFTYGVADPADFAAARSRLAGMSAGWKVFEAEGRLTRWAGSAPGADEKAVNARYLDALIAATDGTGREQAVLSVLDALPRPLPLDFAGKLNLCDLFESGLVPPPRVAEVTRRILALTGETPNQMLRRLVSAGISSGTSGTEAAQRAAQEAGEKAASEGAPGGETLRRMAEAACREGDGSMTPWVNPATLAAMGLIEPERVAVLTGELSSMRKLSTD